jgi:hypothetical protein
MDSEESRSCLVFYEISDDRISDMDFNEIWNNFVIAKIDGVRCSNVIAFMLTPENLLEHLSGEKGNTSIIKLLEDELEAAANIVFVKPVKGRPISGFSIKEVLKIIKKNH